MVTLQVFGILGFFWCLGVLVLLARISHWSRKAYELERDRAGKS